MHNKLHQPICKYSSLPSIGPDNIPWWNDRKARLPDFLRLTVWYSNFGSYPVLTNGSNACKASVPAVHSVRLLRQRQKNMELQHTIPLWWIMRSKKPVEHLFGIIRVQDIIIGQVRNFPLSPQIQRIGVSTHLPSRQMAIITCLSTHNPSRWIIQV